MNTQGEIYDPLYLLAITGWSGVELSGQTVQADCVLPLKVNGDVRKLYTD
jgi:hypothetical protein